MRINSLEKNIRIYKCNNILVYYVYKLHFLYVKRDF